MSILQEFGDWMRDEITWERRTGVDSHGEALYAAAETVGCRIARRQRLVLDQSGQQRVSSVQVHLAQPMGVQVRDRVTLPATMLPRTPVLLAVTSQADDTGSLVEVLFA